MDQRWSATASRDCTANEAFATPPDRYKLLFHRNLAGVYCSVVNGPIVDCNDSIARIFGYGSRDELLKEQPETLYFDPAERRRFIDRILRDGGVTNLEACGRRKDGKPVWVLENASLVPACNGTPAMIEGTVIDITERKSTESKLRERTTYLNALLENSPLGIVVLDGEARVQMCNAAFERLFGLTLSEIAGSNLDDRITATHFRSDAHHLTRKVLDGEIVHVTTRRRRSDASAIDVELHGVPLILDGKIVGAYAIYQDITERRQAENSLRELSARLLRLQDKERRRIARELHDTTGQNLAALATNLVVIAREAPDLPQRARAALETTMRLSEECSRELRTISYLLHPPLLDETGLPSALSWYIEGFRERSGVQVEFKVTPELPRLPGDLEMALFRVVQESLTNIHRHSGSHTAAIVLLLNNAGVTLEVSDRGRGMAPEVLKRIATGSAGLGVGLAGMRERVRQLGGSLTIDSGSRGTTVRAIFPTRKSQ